MSRSDWTPKEVSNGATSGMPIRMSATASSLIGLAYRRQRAQPVSLVGGQVEVRRGDVLLDLLHAGRAGDGHHVGLSDQPGQRHLRRRGAVLRGDLPKSFHQRPHLRATGRPKVGPEAPEVARRRLLVLAGKQALPERAVGDYDPPFLLSPGHQVAVRGAVDQAEP